MPTKIRLVKAMVFPGHVWIWKLDYKESWAPKNWCFWTVVLEKTLESPLGCKEIQPVHPKRDQSWVFIGRTDVEAETPILWPPDAKNQLTWKDPDAGKDWRWEEKGTTEDEMIGGHHWLNGHVSSGRWWWTGRPGMLQSMGLQRVGHDWVTELNWTLFLKTQLLYTDYTPYGKHNFDTHWETKKLLWFTLLLHSLYCSGLKQNLQYPCILLEISK